QQMLGDSVRHRLQIRIEIEILERRKRRVEIEGVMTELVKSFIEIPKAAGELLELHRHSRLSFQLGCDACCPKRHVMVNHLVKAKRGNRFSDVCPSCFALMRSRLEMALMSVRETRNSSAV